MKDKLLELSGSLRFWLILVIGLTFLLDNLGIVPGVYAKALETISGLTLAIRQIDKFI